MRKNTTLCVVVLAVVALFFGCTPKVSIGDVKDDPLKAIEEGIQKTADFRAAAEYSPLDTASKAASNGSISINYATLSGSKASYTIYQDRANQRYYTTHLNNSIGSEWKCALGSDGVFVFKPTQEGAWYGLSLHQGPEGYADTKLGDVLNWTEYDIWSEIQDQYGDFVSEVLNGSYEETTEYIQMTATLTDIVRGLTPTKVADNCVSIGGQDVDAVQITFDISTEASLQFFDALLGFYKGSDTDYDTYISAVCREALLEAGCAFYEETLSRDQFEYRVFLTEYNVGKYYSERNRETSLTIFLDADGGEIISISVLSAGQMNDGMASLKYSWSIDTSVSSGLREEIIVSMDNVNADIESFEHTLSRNLSNGSDYSDKALYTFKTSSEIIRHSNELSYSKSNGAFQLSVASDGRDIIMRGSLKDMQKELRMTIQEVECEGVSQCPISVDVDILASPGKEVPTANAVYKNFSEMSEAETESAYRAFTDNLPENIFGIWEPVPEVDPKLYEEFDETYDYNKDGEINETDKAYYQHLHLILTAPVA